MRTNAIEVGVARAREDLACRYTLAFRIDAGERGRIREIAVRVTRDGLRAIHPSKWRARDAAERRAAALEVAWNAPDLLDVGVVRTHLFPLAPDGRKHWQAALAVRFPVSLPVGAVSSATREFGVTITSGGDVVHRISRTVTIRATEVEEGDEPAVAFVETLRLPPGRYDLRAVVRDPTAGADPWATRATVELPEIPRREAFLVEPLLGQPLEADVAVVVAGETAAADRAGDGFVPMLVSRLDEPVDVTAVTRACLVGRTRGDRLIAVDRALRRDGAVAGALPPVEPEFDTDRGVRCATLVDVLPGSALTPGQYEFDVALAPPRGDVTGGAGGAERRTVRFSIAGGGD